MTVEEHQIAGGMGSAVAEFLANLRDESLETIAKTTSHNADKLFKLEQP